MKNIKETELKFVINKLFPGQEIPSEFPKKLREFIQERLNILGGCCALYLTDNNALNKNFRKFMEDFSTLDCGRREVIIHESGKIDFCDDYRKLKITKVTSSMQY